MYISETWGNMADLWFFSSPKVLLENHVNVKVSWLNIIMKMIFVVLLWVPCKGCGSGSNRGEPLFFSLHGVGTDNRVTPPEYCFICNWQKFQLHGTSPKLWPRHHRIFEVCNCVVTLFLAVICSSEVTTFSQEGKSVFQSQSEKKFSWKGCWFKKVRARGSLSSSGFWQRFHLWRARLSFCKTSRTTGHGTTYDRNAFLRNYSFFDK